jgi:2-polyprenyl-3-methyl-5-hydroxy-6-metoxy-1,4-benzoquinol methylase
MENVNNTYFDGYYKDIWREIVPESLTVKETDFLTEYFKLGQGSRVLDIMCGYGRHAIALARHGISCVAVDNLDSYVDDIKKAVELEKLPVQAVKADVLTYEPEGLFDLALCMGNSLCFFNQQDTLQILSMLSRHIKPLGFFMINSWTIGEIAFNGFRETSEGNVGDIKFQAQSQYFLQPSRIETEHLITLPDGTKETKKAIDYIYSLSEIEAMLNQAAFKLLDVYSVPGKKKFTLGEPRAYVIAQKNA